MASSKKTASRVGRESRSAHGGLKSAADLAGRGQCKAALMAYAMGVGHLAIAADQSDEYEMDADFADVQRNKSIYEKAFMAACLVGGGLSGLRRRRSRNR